MEPLRAPLCDMMVLNMLNHNIIQKKDFYIDDENGGTYLKYEAHQDFFITYEQTMTRRFVQKRGEEHTDFRRVIDSQITELINVINGKEDLKFFLMP